MSGRRLRDYREDREINQQQLAKRLIELKMIGSKGTLVDIERGRVTPSNAWIQAVMGVIDQMAGESHAA